MWEYLIVMAIVAAAAGYMFWRALRRVKSPLKSECNCTSETSCPLKGRCQSASMEPLEDKTSL